jgi:hypothetical protein
MRSTFLIVLLITGLSGCAGSGAIGVAGLGEKQQLIEQILMAPTAICAAVQVQNIQALAALKQALTQPTPALIPH